MSARLKEIVGALRSRLQPNVSRHLVGPFELSALLLIVAAVAGVLLSSVVATSQLTLGLKAISLLGLFVGGTLLLQASRQYFLGLGGALMCGFVAILLATYSGLVINASSIVRDPRLFVWYTDRPAVFLSMLGLLSALMLVSSPWSTRRAWIQPMLVGAGVVLPTVALLILPKGVTVAPANVASRLVGRNDPLLVLGVAALALLTPVQIAGSVVWVYFWVGGAHRLQQYVAAPKLVVAVLAVWTTWLVLGVAGALPHYAGNDLSLWSTLRHADARAWLLAGSFTVAAGVFSSRTKGILEHAEGASAASVGLTYLLGQIGLVLALLVLLVCALLTFQAEPTVAVGAVALVAAALAVGSPITWFAGTKRSRLLPTVFGCVVVLVLVVCAAFVWPTAANTVTGVGLLKGRGIYTFMLAMKANGIVLISLVMCSGMAIGVAVGFVLLARWVVDYRGPWRGSAQHGYALIIAPVCVWMLVGAVLLVPATLTHPFANAFSHWPLPDPSEVAIVACCLATVVAVVRWMRRQLVLLNDRHLTGVVAVSAMAFVPFLVPSAFRSGGNLALTGITIMLLATLASIVMRQLPDNARRRSISWQLGAAALSVPLLAYTAVSAGYSPALVGGTLADIGHNVGLSPLSHLRLLIVLPLTVALMVADHELPWLRGRSVRESRWQDLEADVLVEAVHDGDLPDVLSAPLTLYLEELEPDARRLVALRIAQALAGRYRVRRSISLATQVSRADLNTAIVVAERVAAGHADKDDIARARTTAERISASARLVNGAPSAVRRQLAITLHATLNPGDPSVEELVGAMLVVVEAIARPYRTLKRADDDERDRGMIRWRHALGDIIDAWPGRFTLCPDPTVFSVTSSLAIAPAFVLDDERRRLGLVKPIEHPYVYVGCLVAFIAVLAVLLYLALVVESHVLPHIVRIHH